jgi:signal transduction histidine kinase
MKKRISLRMLVALSILTLGSFVIVAFSILSAKYFINGMDVSMIETMKSIAIFAEPEDGMPFQLGEFTVATQWEDLPEEIKTHLQRPSNVDEQFVRKILQPSYLSPPQAAFFAMDIIVADKKKFVSVILTNKKVAMPQSGVDYFLMIFYTCIGALAVLVTFLFILQRRLTEPLQDLTNWAKSLTVEKSHDVIPDFGFSDLNSMAHIIQNSVISIENSLERERQFLSYASHELRTPISVTKSNITLIQRLFREEQPLEKQKKAADRIERAVNTMAQLTETLLWIHREEGRETEKYPINLGSLIQHICEDLRYIVASRDVSVKLDFDVDSIVLPETLCSIVISNLIRNAFQHTHHGSVDILQKGGIVIISNINTHKITPKQDLGFGLGLLLTEQLVARYGWGYDVEKRSNGRCVTLDLSKIN